MHIPSVVSFKVGFIFSLFLKGYYIGILKKETIVLQITQQEKLSCKNFSLNDVKVTACAALSISNQGKQSSETLSYRRLSLHFVKRFYKVKAAKLVARRTSRCSFKCVLRLTTTRTVLIGE